MLCLLTLLISGKESSFKDRKMNLFLYLFLIIFPTLEFTSAIEDHQPMYNLHGRLKDFIIKSRSSVDPDLQKFSFLPQDLLLAVKENLDAQQISSKCFKDVAYTLLHLKEMWALQMLDSFGKLESGVLTGNTHWVGDYAECLSVAVFYKTRADEINFRGRYCSLNLNISADIPISPSVGVCLPDSCPGSAPQLQASNLELSNIGTPGSSNTSFSFNLTCQAREKHLNGPAKGVIALMCVFCALAVIGSSITATKYVSKAFASYQKMPSLIVNVSPDHMHADAFAQNGVDCDKEILVPEDSSAGVWKKCERFFECFCIFTNGAKLLNTDPRDGEMLCIHGIRFLSMTWVILGHTYIMGFAEISNLVGILDLVNNWPFQIVFQGFYSVDSFFVLSGFLLTYLYLLESSKTKGSMNWCYFYLHRFLRLTPIYMIVLAFSATVYLYLGSGPFWTQADVDSICQKNWWRNLLYINNFQDMSSLCMAWSWYLANDMQFFVISPIILIPLQRWPKIGLSILSLLLFACWATNFVLTYHYDLLVGLANILSLPADADTLKLIDRFMEYFEKLYIKPYTRIAPYLVGMFTGYFLFKRKQRNASKHDLVTICIGWIVATTITLACVYGLYQRNPGLIARSFYNALSRTTWALGLCWVIYVCLIDQADVVNKILSFKLFIPLSRLTYSAYLIHPLIITGYFSNMKSTILFAHPTLVLLFIGMLVATYAIALPVALIFESPIIGLEKLVRKKFSKKD